MKTFSYAIWRAPKFGAWFRIFGYGICVSTMHPLFSERNGYSKVWMIGGLKIKILRPQP